MSISSWVRRRKVDASNLKRFRKDVKVLERLYAQRSYALVRPGSRMEVEFIPIVPRHMVPAMWQSLWWHRVKKLVINGQAFKSLCSVCPRAITCIAKEKKDQDQFKCKANPQDFHVDVRRRRDDH